MRKKKGIHCFCDFAVAILEIRFFKRLSQKLLEFRNFFRSKVVGFRISFRWAVSKAAAASESLLSFFKNLVTSCHYFVIFVTFFFSKSAYFCYFSRNSLLRVPNLSFFLIFLFEKIWNYRKNRSLFQNW